MSSPALIGPYLSHNKELLNCLAGRPLREAAIRNTPLIQALLTEPRLQVNLAGSIGQISISLKAFKQISDEKNQHTALHIATINNQPEMIRSLLQHADIDVNPCNVKGLTPILMATRNGYINALDVIVLTFKRFTAFKHLKSYFCVFVQQNISE